MASATTATQESAVAAVVTTPDTTTTTPQKDSDTQLEAKRMAELFANITSVCKHKIMGSVSELMRRSVSEGKSIHQIIEEANSTESVPNMTTDDSKTLTNQQQTLDQAFELIRKQEETIKRMEHKLLDLFGAWIDAVKVREASGARSILALRDRIETLTDRVLATAQRVTDVEQGTTQQTSLNAHFVDSHTDLMIRVAAVEEACKSFKPMSFEPPKTSATAAAANNDAPK